MLAVSVSVSALATRILAETGNPSSPGVQTVPDSVVTPGWIGFLAIFGVALATVVLDRRHDASSAAYPLPRRSRASRSRRSAQEAARAAAGLDDELRGETDDSGSSR